MCDHEHFDKLRDKVNDLERRDAKRDEQIKTLFNASRYQFWAIWSMALILLLAVVYGAVGQTGFKAVTSVAQEFQSPIK